MVGLTGSKVARLKELLQKARRKAQKVGFTEKEIEKLLRGTRKAV